MAQLPQCLRFDAVKLWYPNMYPNKYCLRFINRIYHIFLVIDVKSSVIVGIDLFFISHINAPR